MSHPSARNALNQYGKVKVEADVLAASPHRLIQMLLSGALENIAVAKGMMGRGDIPGKGKTIGLAISIIDGLRMSLDKQTGGEIAENLDALYDYMGRQLFQANKDNDPAILDEVTGLLKTIKSAWDEIGSTVEHAPVENAVIAQGKV